LTISAGVGDGVASTIFIVHESLQDGFDLLLTVIVTVPTFFAVTTPEELTVAMDVSLELHSSVLSEAFVGFIVLSVCGCFPQPALKFVVNSYLTYFYSCHCYAACSFNA